MVWHEETVVVVIFGTVCVYRWRRRILARRGFGRRAASRFVFPLSRERRRQFGFVDDDWRVFVVLIFFRRLARLGVNITVGNATTKTTTTTTGKFTLLSEVSLTLPLLLSSRFLVATRAFFKLFGALGFERLLALLLDARDDDGRDGRRT